MIAIIDYGAGNLRSVENALGAIGTRYTVASTAAGIEGASKVILPGVGHFGQIARELDAVSARDAVSLRTAILQHIAADKAFLGVCLGMQVLFASSDEATGAAGLGILPRLRSAHFRPSAGCQLHNRQLRSQQAFRRRQLLLELRIF